MSENMTRRQNPELEFERQDLRPGTIFKFLVGLAVVVAVTYFVIGGFYDYLDAYERNHQPQQNPLAPAARADTRSIQPSDINKFPQPRLEGNERIEINDFRLREEQTLATYGWVDQKAGVARIPIDRAMELLAQQGLPTRPQTGNIPPSPVNTSRAAATRSDTSQPPPGKEKKKQ